MPPSVHSQVRRRHGQCGACQAIELLKTVKCQERKVLSFCPMLQYPSQTVPGVQLFSLCGLVLHTWK